MSVEREWLKRTGIVPMAHVMVVRREHAHLARALYDTFVESKALAIGAQELGRVTNFVDVMVPWMNNLVEQNRAIKDGDWWAYGVEANQAATDTFLRYHFEQGLSKRRWAVEEIFAPSTLET